MTFNPKWLIGRTIVGVEMNPFPRGHGYGRQVAYDPVLLLDNGARVSFQTQEADIDYGVEPVYTKPRAPRARGEA